MRRLLLLSALALTSLLPFGSAESALNRAPQLLAVLTTPVAVPLQCRYGQCHAELTSFCLEPERRAPARGTRYEARNADDFVLTGMTADGQTISVPAGEMVAITSLRGHSAIQVTVRGAALRQLGLVSAAVSVAPDVFVAVADEAGQFSLPHTAIDLALAEDVLRPLGRRIVEGDTEAAGAALLTARLVNALPLAERESASERNGLWDITLGTAAQAGRTGARQAYDTCLAKAPDGGRFTMRDCLAARHDQMIGDLNKTYWDALQSGS